MAFCMGTNPVSGKIANQQGTSKMRSQDNLTQNVVSSSTSMSNDQHSSVNSINSSTLSSSQGSNWSKIQALKHRKSELEKMLTEKTNLLQQIQKQEAQILGGGSNGDIGNGNGGVDGANLERNSNYVDDSNNATLRRKIDTSFKLPKKLLNSKDSIRRIHKAELEQAQNKLTAINHSINLLKKRQVTQTKGQILQTPLAPSPATNVITLNLTKSPSVQNTDTNHNNNGIKQCNNDDNLSNLSNNLLNSKKYGSSNSVNNYYTSERRNSNKSMTRNSPKKNDDHTHFDRTLPNHRSDYDLNRLITVNSAGNESLNSYHVALDNNSGYNDYFYNYIVPQQKIDDVENHNNHHQYHQHHEIIDRKYQNDNSIKYNGNNGQSTNSKPAMHLVEGPYPNDNRYYCTPQHPYDDSTLVKSFMTKQGTRQAYNMPGMHGNCIADERYGVVNDKAKYMPSALTSTGTGNVNNMKKYQYDNVDFVPISPSIVASLHDQQLLGLGGYWRTLSNNERVWCVVDNSYDHIKHSKMKKATLASSQQPTKSSSLGNFETITAKDEMIDKISVSSMNSDTNKKPKEKQWLETSLDGPMVKVKSSTNDNNNTKTLPLYCYVPKNNTMTNYPQSNAVLMHHHHSTLSPPFNMYTTHGNSLSHQSHKHQNYRDRPKLSSQSMSNSSYRAPVQKIENQIHLSHSTSVLNNDQFKSIQQHQSYQQHQQQQQQQQQHHQQQQQHERFQLQNQSVLVGPYEQYQYHQVSPNVSNNNELAPVSFLSNQQQSPTKSSVLSSVLGTQYNNFDTIRNNRSPIVASMSKAPDIRIESPKNMTVVQQAIFMPYKEVTKPFEMSDFYKYSTKFRQKESKQQPVATTVDSTNIE